MKVQILWDNLIIAERLVTVAETRPEQCPECGRLKPRKWQVVQTDQAVERIRGLEPSTRLDVRLEPE